MDISREHPARRFEAGQFAPRQDPVVNEVRFEIDINAGQARWAMLCLPKDLEALAVGFLLGEGLLRRWADLAEVTVRHDERKIVVRGDFDAEAMENLRTRWTWGSGCGAGGTSRDLDAPPYRRVAPGPAVRAEHVLEVMRQFQSGLELWKQTGGVHACALAKDDRILLRAEDVGRHNAFDKVIGLAALADAPLAGKYVATTGRLSAEIVSKAVAAGVGVLASRCAVTGLAIDLARRFGVTLVGFARGGRLNVYTGYERVVQADG